MEIEIIKTNIVNIEADAIVIPANSSLKEGSGVSAAVFQAAGRRKLTRACEKIGSCETGYAVPTLAYDLDAKYIIHAVVPKWTDGEHEEYNLLSSAYLSALNAADVMECESIAFPLLASGNNGFDPETAFEIAMKSIGSFSGEKLKKAFLILHGYHITSYSREMGYEVAEVPENMKELLAEKEKRERAEKRRQELNEFLNTILTQEITKAKNYLEDPERRAEIMRMGAEIGGEVIKKIVEKRVQTNEDLI